MNVSPIGEHPSAVLLSKFLSDQTNHEQTGWIIRHVNACENCQHQLDKLSDSSKQLRRKLFDLNRYRKNSATTDVQLTPSPDTVSGHTLAESCELGFIQPDQERFSIKNPIAAGGMGIVYRGYDFELKREVAIKGHCRRTQ